MTGRLSTLLLSTAICALLAGCGGGGGGSTSPTVVASVSIRETGLLLQQPGQSRQLSAVAKDADGNQLDVPIEWSSTKASSLGIDATGKVTAASASGSSQILATAQGVRSAPLLAVVMQPAAGTVLVDDSQVVGEPVETDPNAAPSFANTYKVTLTGIPVPPVGSLLVGTGSKAVAGRVVAVDPSVAGQPVVTLALAPMRQMFPNLQIDEVIDLSQATVTFSEAALSAYTVERIGNTFNFTPKPAVPQDATRKNSQAVAIGTRALGPFGCDDSTISGLLGDPPPLPVQLTSPPLISITIGPTLDLRYTPTNELERFVVKAEPTLKVEGGFTATIAFEGKLSCKLELFQFRIPIGGALSWVFSGLVPVGTGFEVSNKITLASVSMSTKVEAKAKAEIGFICPASGSCAMHGLVDPSLAFAPTVTLPSAGLSGLRLEPGLSVFGTVDAVLGNPFFRSLRWEALKTQFGGKLAGSFATQASQITDAAYKSDYKLSLEAKAGVGVDLDSALGALGLANLSVLELSTSTDIATSPTASVTANRSTFVAGDAVNLKAVLNPTTFLSIYNVDRVVWIQKEGTVETVVSTQTAIGDQTEFNFAFTATGPSSAGDYYAFVITKALPSQLLALELGRVTLSETTSDTCPLFSMTVPGKTGTTREFSGLSLGYETGGGAIGGTNTLSLTAFAGSLSAQSTLYFLVATSPPSPGPVNIMMSWSGQATVEAGSATVAMEVDGVGDSATASANGLLTLTVPVQVIDKQLLKVTFSGSATSPALDKNVNPRGSMVTNSFPPGVSLTPVICRS